MNAHSHISILGAGESGLGAALLARQQGYRFWLSDAGKVRENFARKLAAYEIPYEEGGHNSEHILSSELIVKSPGIPGSAPIVKQARERGIPVISEVEFAARHTQATLVAVTGTNGKTTVAHLVHHLMMQAGLKCTLAGNVGQSFAAAVALAPTPYYALEVSSFQLDDIDQFKPHIAILTNITPDHLDRYEQDLQRYAAAKMNITRNQGAQDYFIWCADDPLSSTQMRHYQGQAQTLPFHLQSEPLPAGAWLDNDTNIQLKIKNEAPMVIKDLALQGKHNTHNSMAAGIAARLLGIRKESIRESLAGFDSLEHRLEPVLEIYGMQFINDSKATNVNATWYALDSLNTPVIWLAGGVDKGNDYSSLYPLVKDKVKAIIGIGEDNSKIKQAFGDKVSFMMDSLNMDEAVRLAYKLGTKGDTILLSPACASFDRFENFEDRGRTFKEAVKEL